METLAWSFPSVAGRKSELVAQWGTVVVPRVCDQVLTARKRGLQEVAFRVALKDGKVAFTARGLKGTSDGEKSE